MGTARQIQVPREGIYEIPTRPSVFKARVVSTAAVMLAGLGAGAAVVMPVVLNRFLGRNAGIEILLRDSGLCLVIEVLFRLMGALGLICAVAGLFSLARSRISYRLLRASLAVAYPLLAGYVIAVWEAVFAILAAGVEIDGSKQDNATALLLWWRVCWPALATVLYVAWLHVMLNSRSVYAAFTGEDGAPLPGDRVLEDLRTHGHDPRGRKSIYASVLVHLLVIIIVPWLMQFGGCVESYKVPKGSGNPVVAMVKMVKPKKEKKKRMTLRVDSPIIFEIPDLDETEVDKVMEEQTQLTYKAMPGAKVGKMGAGGGTTGGWPEGSEDYRIRFIRLDHGGAGWDDGMDDSNADINFLRAFANVTPFKKISSKSESHKIGLLAKYPKDGFPPFVYMTGNAGMGSVSGADQKALREYCLGGGMLIADAGSPRFHDSFTHFIRLCFPDKPLVDIPDDDMIYQMPYQFPDGAPSFWHHGGRRALGIKDKGRWIVFYHPGDMNDAWKSPGYTDVTPEMKEAAMQLGVNLVYYSFTKWNDAVSKARK